MTAEEKIKKLFNEFITGYKNDNINEFYIFWIGSWHFSIGKWFQLLPEYYIQISKPIGETYCFDPNYKNLRQPKSEYEDMRKKTNWMHFMSIEKFLKREKIDSELLISKLETRLEELILTKL